MAERHSKRRMTKADNLRVAGALKGLAALRAIEKAAKTFEPEESTVAFYNRRFADALALATALGPMTPSQEGAVVALGEYIHTCFTTGTPNLEPNGWFAFASLTEDGRKETIKALQAESDEFDAKLQAEMKARRKVVSLAEWRAAQ